MPRLRSNVNPSYRLHKQSGQAVVTLSGRDVLLGKFDSTHSRQKYEQLVFEWRASGRQLPVPRRDKTVAELLVPYREHVLRYYRHEDKTPTGESETIRAALRPLRTQYGATAAMEFGPLQLKALREKMISPSPGGLGWARTTTNKQINRVRQFFKWCVENGHLDGSISAALSAVAPLKAGRSEARETERKTPIPEHFVYKVLPHVPRRVSALVQLQLLTGARGGELLPMRTLDIDRSGKIWVYRPHQHKNRHRGHAREIYFGPDAQEVLGPFLKPNLSEPIFSPADEEAERRELRHKRRRTPLGIGNGPGDVAKVDPKRRPGTAYTPASYRKAIARGCDKADLWCKGGRVVSNDERIIPRWHPHLLRHTAATRFRSEYGLEISRILLGVKSMDVVQIYAEADTAKAMHAIGKIG